jgi:regulator of replication initiation timing
MMNTVHVIRAQCASRFLNQIQHHNPSQSVKTTMSSSSDNAFSSPGHANAVVGVASKKGNSAVIVALNNQETQINKHDADIEGLEIKIRRLTEDNKTMREELDSLKRTITIYGKVQASTEARITALQAAQSDVKDSSDSDSEEDSSDEEGGGKITKREEDAITASLAAYSDSSLKVSQVMYQDGRYLQYCITRSLHDLRSPTN